MSCAIDCDLYTLDELPDITEDSKSGLLARYRDNGEIGDGHVRDLRLHEMKARFRAGALETCTGACDRSVRTYFKTRHKALFM